MQEHFFTRSEWLGVEFVDLGIPLDPTRPASVPFYDALYAELHRRHAGVDEFPSDWRATKEATAECLSTLIGPRDRVLSFGAGIGNVETTLVERHGVEQVYLWDAARLASRFLPRARHRYVPGTSFPEPEDGQPFDVICVVQVLYAFERGRAAGTLARLRDLLARDGRMILVDGSAVPAENGVRPGGSEDARGADGDRGHRSTVWLATGRGDVPAPAGHQGWGWSRDDDCRHAICAAAGLAVSRSFPAAGQSVTVATRAR